MARTRKPLQTNGSISSPELVKSVITQPASASIPHQTHGGYTPLSGPITNVSQLTNGGRSVAKGSVGSFDSLASYTKYLRTLSLGQLHRHAVEEAKVVPIDDRERLIRRLETEWTASASKYPGRGAPIPQPKPFTAEQLAAQAELRNKLLHR